MPARLTPKMRSFLISVLYEVWALRLVGRRYAFMPLNKAVKWVSMKPPYRHSSEFRGKNRRRHGVEIFVTARNVTCSLVRLLTRSER